MINKFSLLLIFLLGYGANVQAHSTTDQNEPGINVSPDQITDSSDFPLAVGGEFSLIDHNGNAVTDKSYLGKHMLVFFGYASCKNMCSLSLSRLGKALDLLGPLTEKLSPLVITVDPERDTPAALRSSLAKYHSGLIGLTGQPGQIETAYKAYKQTPSKGENDWEGDPIISHSSYFYLMDQKGEFQTLFPPILNPQSMAKIMKKYIDSAS